MASICVSQTRVQIIANNGHQVSAKAVCVPRLNSAADNRTERLHVPLPASISRCNVVSCREVGCLPSGTNGFVALDLAILPICTLFSC